MFFFFALIDFQCHEVVVSDWKSWEKFSQNTNHLIATSNVFAQRRVSTRPQTPVSDSESQHQRQLHTAKIFQHLNLILNFKFICLLCSEKITIRYYKSNSVDKPYRGMPVVLNFTDTNCFLKCCKTEDGMILQIEVQYCFFLNLANGMKE